MTNKGSNILEDLEILRLLAKTVPDYVQTLSEEGIVEAAFDLLFAFDEVISLGYKENVTLQQVPVRRPVVTYDWLPHSLMSVSPRPALVGTTPLAHAACLQPVEAHISGSTSAARRSGVFVSHTVNLSAGAGPISAA